jgi:tetratricopeptide (TPR) repeat protein
MRLFLVWLCLGLACWGQPVGAQNKFKVGRGHFKRGYYERAIAEFEAAIKEDQGYLDAHYLMGLSYLGLDQFAKAEEKLTYVISLDSGFIEAYQYLGQAQVAQKKFELARKTFQRLSSVPSAASSAQYCLGVVAYQEGNLALAEKCWNEAIRLDPREARSRNNLGILRSAEGKHTEALTLFQAAWRNQPEKYAYQANEATELIYLNRPEAARQILAKLGRLSEIQPDVREYALALQAKLDSKWEVVVNRCDNCLSTNKEHSQALLLQAEAFEKLGKAKEAGEAYAKALASDPNLKQAQQAVERLKAAEKKPDEKKPDEKKP